MPLGSSKALSHPAPMTTVWRTALLLLVFIAAESQAQSSLPPEVQADILKTRIVDALSKQNVKGALLAFDQYRQLKVAMPPALLFLEAKAAWVNMDAARAFNALEEFLKVAPREGDQYKRALALYPEYQARAAEVQRKLDEQRQAAEAAKLAAVLQQVPMMLAALQANMVSIPGGALQMGSASGYQDEKPVHTVNIKPFMLGKYEVTFEQYDVFATATGRPLPDDSGWGRGKRPVIEVSWDDAQAFVAWLNQQSGLKFRLPSEAEWEYAARAGSTTDYPWGKTFDASKANGQGTSTALVGSFPPNAFGLHDLIGNVWEWTQDCWNDTYTGAPSDGSAWLSGECSRRVERGGAWNYDAANLRVSIRGRNVTTHRNDNLGFRLAQDQ
ncbi:MAG: formylglycine-generating enzyme family protein [Gammaproteobacteria bacterium]|nr:MAG: formylglycine-generating enzyme family protein [Gammaproteobacteria bacterium]